MIAARKAREERVDAAQKVRIKRGALGGDSGFSAGVVERKNGETRCILGTITDRIGGNGFELRGRLGELPRAAQTPRMHEPTSVDGLGKLLGVGRIERGLQRDGGTVGRAQQRFGLQLLLVGTSGGDLRLRLVVKTHCADILRHKASFALALTASIGTVLAQDSLAVLLHQIADRREFALGREQRHRLAEKLARIGVATALLNRARRSDPRPVARVLARRNFAKQLARLGKRARF